LSFIDFGMAISTRANNKTVGLASSVIQDTLHITQAIAEYATPADKEKDLNCPLAYVLVVPDADDMPHGVTGRHENGLSQMFPSSFLNQTPPTLSIPIQRNLLAPDNLYYNTTSHLTQSHLHCWANSGSIEIQHAGTD
jgi:hypothetical protein